MAFATTTAMETRTSISKRFKKLINFACLARFLVHFLCFPCTTTTWNFHMRRVEEVKISSHGDDFFLSSSLGAAVLGDPGAVSRVERKDATKVTKTKKLSSRLFSRPDWLPLGLRGWGAATKGATPVKYTRHVRPPRAWAIRNDVVSIRLYPQKSTKILITSSMVCSWTRKHIVLKTQDNEIYQKEKQCLLQFFFLRMPS